jgi:acetylornithine deacetylase
MTPQQIKTESIELLKKLISTPSFSRDESNAADIMAAFLMDKGFEVKRKGNNVWVHSPQPSKGKKVILFNSHIDTVKPASGYTRDPFSPDIADGKLFGLGSNDAGGPLVSLLAAFRILSSTEQPYHLIYSATAEEEVSGKNGVESILAELGPVDFAIVGEPTRMQMAVAEKGLMVLDCTAHGQSGHAAREEGVNALYKALTDIEWFRNHRFEKVSDMLGPVKMTVTQINAGTQHNVVPDKCSFVVDVRVNELYSNVQVLEIIKSHVGCTVEARSTRVNSSHISASHPFVVRGTAGGIGSYGSPTTSDQALMPFTTIKMGPGDSARSHTADEFIFVDELWAAPDIYVKLLDGLVI